MLFETGNGISESDRCLKVSYDRKGEEKSDSLIFNVCDSFQELMDMINER